MSFCYENMFWTNLITSHWRFVCMNTCQVLIWRQLFRLRFQRFNIEHLSSNTTSPQTSNFFSPQKTWVVDLTQIFTHNTHTRTHTLTHTQFRCTSIKRQFYTTCITSHSDTGYCNMNSFMAPWTKKKTYVTNQAKRGNTRVACVKRAVQRTMKGHVTDCVTHVTHVRAINLLYWHACVQLIYYFLLFVLTRVRVANVFYWHMCVS